MKYPIKIVFTTIVVVVVFVLMDSVLGSVMTFFYSRSKYGIFGRQIYCLSESNEDIIVLGSSRAAHHYVPSIFKDSLNISCYNAGSDGMCIYYHYAVLSSYIASGRTPKLLIYDLNDFDLLKSEGTSFTLEAALDRLAPHYGEYAEIDSLFALKGWKQRLKMNVHSYRYNSKLVQLIKSNFIPSNEDNGYEAIYGSLPDSDELHAACVSENILEEEKVEVFHKMLQKLRQYNVPIVLVYSPIYEKAHSSIIDKFRSIAKIYGVPLLDFSNHRELMYPSFFRDATHLNDSGAHCFTRILQSHIREIINHE